MAAVGDVLGGRYRLVRLLGQGGMSDVYEALDQTNDTAVAVKIVRSPDPELALRVAREVQALSRVAHSGLVRLLDSGLVDVQAFLVMELVEGSTLAAALREGPLGPARTADLGVELAGALAYVHAQGMVHRDVKPSNILVEADGTTKLSDFGIARLDDASTLTIVGSTLGTAAYMAPEQLEDHRVGPSADVWSLGMVLLECLTGHRIYEGSASEVVTRRLAGPLPIPANLPVPWALILSGMLDHRPERRLEADEVAALLATEPFRAEWAATPPSADRPAQRDGGARSHRAGRRGAGHRGARARGHAVGAPPPVPARQPDRRWWAVVAVLALVALVVGLVLGLGSNPPSRLGSATTTTTHAKTTSTSSTTTSTSTTTTTTAAVAAAPAALAALVGDVASGQSAGTIDQGSAQSISSQAQQAISDESAGKANQAANDLQQVAMTIAMGEQHGKISSAEGATLQHDLSALASRPRPRRGRHVPDDRHAADARSLKGSRGATVGAGVVRRGASRSGRNRRVPPERWVGGRRGGPPKKPCPDQRDRSSVTDQRNGTPSTPGHSDERQVRLRPGLGGALAQAGQPLTDRYGRRSGPRRSRPRA